MYEVSEVYGHNRTIGFHLFSNFTNQISFEAFEKMPSLFCWEESRWVVEALKWPKIEECPLRNQNLDVIVFIFD